MQEDFTPTFTKLAYLCFFIVIAYGLNVWYVTVWTIYIYVCMRVYSKHVLQFIVEKCMWIDLLSVQKCNVSITILMIWANEQSRTVYWIYRIFAFKMDVTPQYYILFLSAFLLRFFIILFLCPCSLTRSFSVFHIRVIFNPIL